MKIISYITILHVFSMLVLNNVSATNNNKEIAIYKSKDGNNFHKAIEEIVINCFNKYIGYSLLIGNWRMEDNVMFDFTLSLNPIYLMNTDVSAVFQNYQRLPTFYEINEETVSKKSNAVTNVTIFSSSTTTLRDILENLRNSIWWNSKAFFMLINSDSQNGCGLASEFLKICWSFKILSVIYFCKNNQTKLELYSFNPYGVVETAFWKTVHTHDIRNNKWTLLNYSFEQSFKSLRSLDCRYLDFDKTNNLRGYEFRVGLVRDQYFIDSSGTKLSYPWYKDVDFNKFNEVFLKRTNVHVNIKFYSSYGFFANGEPQGFLKDIQMGKIDCMLKQMFSRDYWNMQTYPYQTNGICIVSLKIRNTFVHRLFSVFNITVSLYIIVTAFISIIILKYILEQSFISSVFECLRAIASLPTHKQPQNSFKKLLFIVVLFLLVVTNSYIQSCFIALETVSEYNPTVNTADDLIKSDLQIFARIIHKNLMGSEFSKRLHIIDDYTICYKFLLKGKNLVCLVHADYIQEAYNSSNGIYKAQNNIINRPIAFTISPDLPLVTKINKLLSRSNDAGILQHCNKRSKMSMPFNNINEINNVNMKQLTFYFLLFSWSSAFAMCTFLVEVIIGRIGL